MKNKIGGTNPIIYVVIALVGGFLLFSSGIFDKAITEPTIPTVGPSDQQTTFDIAWKDELATTETAVSSALWYAFKATDGAYVNSGTASSGTASFTTNYGQEYDIWSYTTGYEGYLAKLTRVDATAAKVPVTITLIKRGGLDVVGVDDPIDLDTNITGTAGATEEFRAKWKVNVSNAGTLDPIIFIETNTTSTGIEDLTISKADSAGGTYTEISCPNLLTQSSVKEVFYCFKRDKMALANDGVIITYFTVKIDGTTAPGDSDQIKVRMIDTGMYLKPGYTNIDGVLFDAEDDSNAEVGLPSQTVITADVESIRFGG